MRTLAFDQDPSPKAPVLANKPKTGQPPQLGSPSEADLAQVGLDPAYDPSAEIPPAIPDHWIFRIEIGLFALMWVIFCLSDAGWNSLLFTTLGMGQFEILDMLASSWVLAALIIMAPFWWFRCSHWATTQEDAHWGRGSALKGVFLLLHWPMPIAMLFALAIARECWNRMSKPNAIASHRRFFRWMYGFLLAISFALTSWFQ